MIQAGQQSKMGLYNIKNVFSYGFSLQILTFADWEIDWETIVRMHFLNKPAFLIPLRNELIFLIWNHTFGQKKNKYLRFFFLGKRVKNSANT